MAELLLYGSYGFVGDLLAREALERGFDPLLAGRDYEELQTQARELGCSARQFSLTDPAVVSEALEDVDCVLNAAGPFSNTAEPLADGCIETGTDYVDITGEIPVIQRLRDRSDTATDAGVTLFPSVGFSSVPGDCLAAHLAERLPEATWLAIGAESFRVPSVGSLKTVVEGIETGGAICRNGGIQYVPAAWQTREIDFGRGLRSAVTMPLGDVATAHATTGIPNVEAYAVAPTPTQIALRLHRYLAPVLAAPPVKRSLKRVAELVRDGPSERRRQRGEVYLWGEARADGEHVVSRLRTPDAYVVTVDAALRVTERVLSGDVDSGYQTPAGSFGPEFVLELDGVTGFEDEPHSRDWSTSAAFSN